MRNPFSAPKPKAQKIKAPPAPRKPQIEALLCEAISKQVLVSLQYAGDVYSREFEPSVVYHSSKDRNQVNVAGCQIRNPNARGEDMAPHVFEVGKIAVAKLTEKPFVVRDTVNPQDQRYTNGIVCLYRR